MMQHFIDGKNDLDSIIDMSETSIFFGFSNYTNERKALFL
jgi:hypothetical protein